MPKVVKLNIRLLWELGIYCGLNLGIILLYRDCNLFIDDVYYSLIAFDSLTSLLTVCFLYRHWKALKPLFFWRSVKIKEMIVLICLAIILGVCASSLAAYLNELFYNRSHQLSFIFWDTPYPKTLSIFFICLQPAIVEELSYRGLLIYYLKEVSHRRWVALVGSALIFSFMHLNIMGMIWLMPLGLLLAYFRIRYRSLWYGVLAHFCYNLIILWLEW